MSEQSHSENDEAALLEAALAAARDDTSLLREGVLRDALVQAGARPSIVLRGIPVAVPVEAPSESWTESGEARYAVQGEIAHGGMGVILKAHDQEIGREIAIKVLRDRHRDDVSMLLRFVEEAQIGGQLQHPGIVPVYDLGLRADQRPFFTMKLVHGKTLAELLSTRASDTDRRRLLAIFERICQAVAYAHARGVLHRDLKPANVMVGNYGEVQVMDWGLAKVRSCEDQPDRDEQERAADAQPVHTRRSGSTGSGSVAGAVIGTPAYMAPEQARGEAVDERSDVFGLGAMLCEILTGSPPYAAESPAAILAQAREGDLEDAVARLDGLDAEPELIALAQSCVAVDPERRPVHAGVVAEQVHSHLAAQAERLRVAELARTAAEARAEVERRARRRTVWLSAAVLFLLVLGGGGFVLSRLERQARAAETARAVRAALTEATRERVRARADDDLVGLGLARVAAERAQSVLQTGEADEELSASVELALAAIDADVTAANEREQRRKRDQRMVDRLDVARALMLESTYLRRQAEATEQAFRDYGIDVAELSPVTAARRIRESSIRLRLVMALDDWARACAKLAPNAPAYAPRLFEIAQAADPDEWRSELRASFHDGDSEGILALARSVDLRTQPPATIGACAALVVGAGNPQLACELYTEALRRNPDDFWLHARLAGLLMGHSDLAARIDAVGHAQAARALRPKRPEAWWIYGTALSFVGNQERALTALQKVLELDPDEAFAHANIAACLMSAHGSREVAAEYSRKAIVLNPKIRVAHVNLANALRSLGHSQQAIEAVDAGLEHFPGDVELRVVRTRCRAKLEQLDEAIDELDAVLSADSDNLDVLVWIGHALHRRNRGGDLRRAIELLREATELAEWRARNGDDPLTAQEPFVSQRAYAWLNLGIAYRVKGDRSEELTAIRKATEVAKDDAEVWSELGNSLRQRREFKECIEAYQKAIQRQPDYVVARANLAEVLRDRGRGDEATGVLEEGLGLRPQSAELLFGLGNAVRLKDPQKAIGYWQRAIDSDPTYWQAHYNLGVSYRDVNHRLEDAIEAFERTLELLPKDAWALQNLCDLYTRRGDLEKAQTRIMQAIPLDPDEPSYRQSLGNVLLQLGAYEDCINANRTCLELDSTRMHAAIHIAMAHTGLGRYAAAIEQFKRAREISAETGHPDDRLPTWIADAERMLELDKTAEAFADGAAAPAEAQDRVLLARVCTARGLAPAAARAWQLAFAADASLLEDAGQLDQAILAAARAALDALLDAPLRRRWCMQALAWMTRAWHRIEEQLADESDPTRYQALTTLAQWARQIEFEPLASVVAELPAEERGAWTQILEAVLDRQQEMKEQSR